jgi:hypothetical protein
MKLILAQIWAMVAGSLTTRSASDAADGTCIFAALFLAHPVKYVDRSLSRLDCIGCESIQAATRTIQVWVARRTSFKSVNAVPGICRRCETSMNTESAQALILHPHPSL